MASASSSIDHAVASFIGLSEASVFPLTDFTTLVAATLIYAATIISLKLFMRANPNVSVDTKTFSKIHNYFLCLISFVMFAGAFFHFFVAKTAPPSFQDAFCNLEGVPLAPEFSFWIYMYYLSKFYEYVDTIILVLNRRPIIFLHAYHHTIVPFVIWAWVRSDNVLCLHGLMANTGVHVLMYYYYGSNNRNTLFKRLITQLQIFQFAISFVIGIVHVYYHLTLDGCNDFFAFGITLFVNITFFFLFINFFGKTYRTRSARPSAAPKAKDDGEGSETVSLSPTATATATTAATAATATTTIRPRK